MCRHIMNENYVHHNDIAISGELYICACGVAWENTELKECPNDGEPLPPENTPDRNLTNLIK